MKLTWEIESIDIEKIKKLIDLNKNHPFVLERRLQNLNDRSIKNIIDREKLWEGMIMALLTSVQRSGSSRPISIFLNIKPSPLCLNKCLEAENIIDYVTLVLKNFGGIRRYKIIAKSIQHNLDLLNSKNWEIINDINSYLPSENYVDEQKIARKLMDLKGIKSKQSRNLIQFLGLTRFEIPLDSRVMNWFNQEFDFPIILSSKGMNDEEYYSFILGGIRLLCEKVNIFPCELDAMIFSLKET